ncbi:MAG: NUDIX domain-containing protein [Kiritimatiellae bacterium]|nr:NUDIX domain-containing protein [Kiritimatiellia bacterium]
MKSEVIEVIVRGVCIKDDMLLVCHTKGAANTYLPGGHIDFDESATQALRREIREELGLDCNIGEFLGAVEHRFIQKGDRHCEINLVFALILPGVKADEEPVSCENHIDFMWVKMDALSESALEPCALKAIIGDWCGAGSNGHRWATSYK